VLQVNKINHDDMHFQQQNKLLIFVKEYEKNCERAIILMKNITQVCDQQIID
jgi:hypothetical protein